MTVCGREQADEVLDQANNPLLTEEEWLRSKETSRGYRSSADGVVAHNRGFGMHSRNLACERPPRPLHQRSLRDIVLMSRPPLLSEEGNVSYPNQLFTLP